MKTRAVEEIARDLSDAKRRLDDLARHGDEALDAEDLRRGCNAAWAISFLTRCVRRWETELRKARRYGVQMSLGF